MAVFEVINSNDNGNGSLRQAIADSNERLGIDEIKFADSLGGSNITLTSGQLQISDDLKITGLGADSLTVSGNNASRVFWINDGNPDNRIKVEIDGLTIAEGGIFNGSGELGTDGDSLEVSNSTIENNLGNGIENFNSDLKLEKVVVTNNSEAGISNYNSQVAIEDSIITRNANSGIFNSDGSQVVITNSQINDNQSSGDGGGITNFSGGEIELIDSKVSGNTTSRDGGGIANGGGLSGGGYIKLSNSEVYGNFAVGSGGGIIDNGRSTRTVIENSSVTSNRGNSGGGVVSGRYGTVEIVNSSISGNEAQNSGGGIFGESYSTTKLTNVSLYGNSAGRDGGAIFESGQSQLNILNSTITGNSATRGGGIYGSYVANSDSSIGNTIIAKNRNDNDVLLIDRQGNNNDVWGVFTSQGNNLIGNNNGSEGFDNPNDLVGTLANPLDPLLEMPANNGGTTATIKLKSTSPAIDAGNNNLVDNLNTERRENGFSRIVDGNGDGIATVDIGAFEVQTSDLGPILGMPKDDVLTGSETNDILKGKNGNDTLDGGIGNDTILGNRGSDRLAGGEGDDVLRGNLDNDLVDGGAGNDLIHGGYGNDTLIGGTGSDRFILQTGRGADIITDYQDQSDRLVLRDGIEFDALKIVQNNSDTQIKMLSTDEVLVTLNSISPEQIDITDFS